MIIRTQTGREYDTDLDLGPAERHVLQKLFLWEPMVASLEEFREKKVEALSKGWNDSGPVSTGPALGEIITEMEARVSRRTGGQASKGPARP